MTILQMKYFITVARCLSFTKAAEMLYVTQPSLSRQITAMEQELNMQLFIRSTRSVRLTPAAKVLLKEFEKIYDDYNLALLKAKNSFEGLQGELNIGVLEGMYIGNLLPEVLQHMSVYYPQVKINLKPYSFNQLVKKLYQNELDLIFTLLFDVKDRENIRYAVVEQSKDFVVVHKDHPLARQERVKLADLAQETFLMVSPEDSEMSPRLIIEACTASGFSPNVKFASSLSEEMLWVEAGIGVCILDSRNQMYQSQNPSVVFLEVETISDPSLTLAWHGQHYNPMKSVFVRNFLPDRTDLEL